MDYFGDYSIESASCHPSSLTHRREPLATPTSDPFNVHAQFSPRDQRPSAIGHNATLINVSVLTRDLQMSSIGLESSPASDVNFMHRRSRSRSPPSDPLSVVGASRPALCWRRRLQRQRDLRLQTDPGHLRAIRDMVNEMDQGQQQQHTHHGTRLERHGVNIMTGILGTLSINTDISTQAGIDDDDEDNAPALSTSPSSIESLSAVEETDLVPVTRPSALIYSLANAGPVAKARRSIDFASSYSSLSSSSSSSPIAPKFGGISKARHRRSGVMRL